VSQSQYSEPKHNPDILKKIDDAEALLKDTFIVNQMREFRFNRLERRRGGGARNQVELSVPFLKVRQGKSTGIRRTQMYSEPGKIAGKLCNRRLLGKSPGDANLWRPLPRPWAIAGFVKHPVMLSCGGKGRHVGQRSALLRG
jgi:hypothetical protein